MRMLAVVLALSVVSPALAAEPTGEPTAKPVKEKKICKTAQDLSGTRLGSMKRDCRTKAEWDAERAGQQRDLERMRRNG